MYASVADVQALLPEFEISATSKPTASEVESIIAQASGEVDGVLRAQGYASVPATGANDLALLRGHVARYTAAHTYLAAFLKDEPPYKVKAWIEGWRDFIARLRRGEQQLIDQASEGESDAVFGFVPPVARDDYFS